MQSGRPHVRKLVASPSYIDAEGAPQTPQEIANHRVVMREAEVWKFVDGDDITAVRPTGRFIADNALSLVAAAVEGVGLAYLPEPLVADHIASGALVAVMNRYPVPPAGIFVVRAPQSLSVGESEDAHGDAY